MLTAPASAEPEPATAQPAKSADPVKTAKTTAKAQNKRIEIESLQSDTSTFYANPDGKTLFAEVSSTPVRVHKDGSWQPIDPRLIEKTAPCSPRRSRANCPCSPAATPRPSPIPAARVKPPCPLRPSCPSRR